MTAKEYLSRISMLDAQIKTRQNQVEELKALVEGSRKELSADRIQSSTKKDTLAECVIRWIQFEKEITVKLNKLIKLKNRIIGQIYEMDNLRHIRILELRYVEQKKWEEIADDMKLDLRYIYRLHGYALQDFTNRFLKKDDI